MIKLKALSGLETIPKPSEYFDLIGGTTTGRYGLCYRDQAVSYYSNYPHQNHNLALLLGRLHMSVDEVKCYASLSEEIFTTKPPS
jgi:hypothetical protein